jgi:hypothetical protein
MNSVPTTASTHEEEVKRAAELKEWLESRISDLEIELAHLKDMMTLVDATLRKTSFVPAAVLRTSSELVPATPRIQEQKKPLAPQETTSAVSQKESDGEGRQLRRSKDGKILATAYVDSDKIVIVPDSGTNFSQVTPPFQSFFVNRILKGYQAKDEEQSKAGSLPSEKVLNYNIQESEGNISSITITNYRERVRLNEILSTVTWALTRMLEKK